MNLHCNQGMQCVYPIQMYRCFLVLLHSDTKHLGIGTYEFVYMVELKRNLECSDMYYSPPPNIRCARFLFLKNLLRAHQFALQFAIIFFSFFTCWAKGWFDMLWWQGSRRLMSSAPTLLSLHFLSHLRCATWPKNQQRQIWWAPCWRAHISIV